MTQRKGPGRPKHQDQLTPAEWRVAEGVRHGLTNPQLAARLSISADGVKFHVSNILAKLGFTSRDELRQWDGVQRGSAMAGAPGLQEPHAFGSLGQVARSVSSLDEAVTWYRDVLGLPYLFSAGGMAFFDCGGTRLMLSEGEVQPESILYFRTTDLHGKHQAMGQHGVTTLSAPHRVHQHPDGTEEWMCFIEDNDGRPLALIATLPATQATND